MNIRHQLLASALLAALAAAAQAAVTADEATAAEMGFTAQEKPAPVVAATT